MSNLLSRPVHLVVSVVRFPLSAAAYSVGLARGAATSLLRVVTGAGGSAHSEWTTPTDLVAEETAEPEVEYSAPRAVPDLPPAAPPQAPGRPGEQFVTEPSAVSRASAHGGGGHDQDIDDWYGEADSAEPAEGVIASLEAGDELAREEPDLGAVISEAEILRRASERNL